MAPDSKESRFTAEVFAEAIGTWVSNVEGYVCNGCAIKYSGLFGAAKELGCCIRAFHSRRCSRGCTARTCHRCRSRPRGNEVCRRNVASELWQSRCAPPENPEGGRQFQC